MASAGMLAEIRETRRELARLNADFAKMGNTGATTGKTFGKKFKEAAITGVKEMAKGALFALGENLMGKFLERGKKGGHNFGKGFKKAAQKEMDDLGKNPGASGLKMNLAALPIIGAGLLAATIAGQMSGSLQKAFERERLTISFNALSADGGGGSRIFEDLRQDALRTGQEIASMAGMVQRFMGLGFAEKDALKLNDSLLDIAGSLGMSASEAAGLGSALAQVKAKGVASMEELRQQIAEKGVPVFQVLAAKLGITEAAVISMVSAGKLGADVVIEAFQNLEGPLDRFRGGADRMASSAGGMFERIQRHAEDLKLAFGEGMLPELSVFFDTMLANMGKLREAAAAFGAALGDALGWVSAAIGELELVEMLHYAALTYKKGMDEAFMLAQRHAIALVSVLSGDEFSRALARAALDFKSLMFAILSDLSAGMAALMPDNFLGRKAKAGLMGAAVGFADQARGARAQRDEIKPADFFKLKAEYEKALKEAEVLSTFDGKKWASINERINKRKVANRAEFESKKPASSAGGGTTSSTAGGMAMAAPGGLLAGGLANAISRISGGPSTLLMTRQLDAMKAIQTSTASNVAATNKVASAVDRLTQKISVFS